MTANAYGMAILQLYNSGLKTKQLAPWQTHGFNKRRDESDV